MSTKMVNERYVFVGGKLHGLNFGTNSIVWDQLLKEVKQIIEIDDETYYLHEIVTDNIVYKYYTLIPIGLSKVEKIKGRISH